ncbi:diaminopimelate decarboxylase [Tepidanaerobacter acetatoxydans Re1]|uniref:Diaminopimelate decarboxylase n=1 Tax=Tepidanaerobacter acetatoxydans (strain DSM 21804 / JCM 16047 / Re1) TaxID=1209989 RepID=F4LUY7_TEPAE|nr:diaminopimelate decarboxylase [Tepidanaerobacter acetatoxydans]AEE91513.1 diaminopimelate decarboxylase [Tepidanaerobacter acetatoxydans Re1]CCP26227.1 diaminopimelate decarboxylase [Tepidanaerobacter acetatoxydans Re1]
MFCGTGRINKFNHLEIGGCDAVELAKEFGTPLYVMDENHIRENCRLYRDSLNNLHENSEVIYAGKAFLTMEMCKLIEEEGLSLDVVSGGELYTAIKSGFPSKRIYFHGNNKSYAELEMAAEYGVGRIVVDNFYELELLRDVAKKYQGKKIKILLRLTPGIEAHTHDYIKTGQLDSKFGFGMENGHAFMAVENALSIKGLKLMGFHCHIGSQIFEDEPFKDAAKIMIQFAKIVNERYDFRTREIDFGGGFGIRYTEKDKPLAVKNYIEVLVESVKEACKKHNMPIPKILIEPGRAIVGEAGTTLYTIGSIKNIPGVRKYVSVDGGMSDNIRPALYGAEYSAVIANKAGCPREEIVSIAGKCCESGDMLIWDINLPKIMPGDILAVFTTGAYHYSMASNYNMMPKPAVVFVKNKTARLVVRRQTYEDLLSNEVFMPNSKNISLASL